MGNEADRFKLEKSLKLIWSDQMTDEEHRSAKLDRFCPPTRVTRQWLRISDIENPMKFDDIRYYDDTNADCVSLDKLRDRITEICALRNAYDEGIPDELVCPINSRIMMDPCVVADGHSYERSDRAMVQKQHHFAADKQATSIGFNNKTSKQSFNP